MGWGERSVSNGGEIMNDESSTAVCANGARPRWEWLRVASCSSRVLVLAHRHRGMRMQEQRMHT